METGKEKVIQSISRAVQILQCFDKYEELGVTEISRMAGLHKSTAFGLISSLEANRLLEKDEATGRYKLGLELFRLGTKVNVDLRRIAVPYLEKLVKLYQETVNLVMLEDLSVIYLEKVEGTHSMRISTTVGGRRPLHCTAVGKAILAGLSIDEMHSKLDRMELTRYTERTICSREVLLQYLMQARAAGYAEENEELEIGLCCVAAPIYNHLGNAFAAISISGPASRMNEDFRREIRENLIGFTREISGKLGHTVTAPRIG